MSLTITIPGAVNVTTGSFAPAVLTIGVGVPGAQGPQGPAGPGVPAGGTAGQFLTKINGTDYNTDWTTVNLAAYAVKANNLSDLTSASTARTNLGLGTMATATAADYSTTVVNNGLYYPLSGNPSSFLTASALTGYATQSFVAANYAPIAAGLPTGGTVGQVLTKNSGTDYDDSWQTLIPGDRYVTSSTTSNTIGNGAKTFTVGTGLSYSSQQDVVISFDASNHMHAVVTSYNSGTGVLVVDVRSHTGSGTYSSWTVNVGGTTPLQTVEWGEILGTLGDQSDLATALNGKLETSTAASTYAALAGATFTGEVVTPASTTSNAGLTITPGVAPTTPTNGELWATTTDLQVRLNGVTETVAEQSWVTANFYPLTGNPSGFLTSASLSGYALLSGATFTGLVGTPASTTTTAGLNIPHGAAPTTPVNGDLWTTTGGLFWRQNGSTQQAVEIGSTQTISGNKTFSNANVSLGTSTAAGTINVGTGATISGATKTINIGTAGVSGSTTNINLGTVSGGGATITLQNNTTVGGTLTVNGASLSLGTSTAAGTIGIGTGATVSGSTRTINIGTASAAGSTNAIVIGGGSGTSTTTLQGTTNGVTVAADTNSTALATTAYVIGQAGSATPLVDGTAAVGTSLRYARQDHVHPTDTSRAALAGATFTGLVSTPASAGGGAGFRINHGAAPTVPANGDVWTTLSGFFVNLNGVTTQMAGLASPTFTGTPAAPTAAADTNTTQLATTAFVVAQAGSATPLVDGTAAVGTSLRYARQDHVHPTDTTRAALASPAFTGTPTAPTAAAATNTTQIATTAFVQQEVPAASTTAAGKVELATRVEAVEATTNTVAVTPLQAVDMLMHPGYVQIAQNNSQVTTFTSGAGAGIFTTSMTRVCLGPNTATAGSVYYRPQTNGGVAQLWSRGNSTAQINFSKKVWMSGRSTFDSTHIGDANNTARVTIGKSGVGAGALAQKGIGWQKAGGSTANFFLLAHNGTTLTSIDTNTSLSSLGISGGATFDWSIYSDGTGNVTMWINDTQVATTSAGPTGLSLGNCVWQEEVDQTASAATRMYLTVYGGHYYHV